MQRASACRLDQALVARGLSPSREQAQRAILAGRVRVGGRPAHKASERVRPEDPVELLAGERYVSRGGYKLQHALQHFQVDVIGARAVDLGASTGGFTDCLLQHGAARVWAVDVGRGLLAWKLRQDPRVVVVEGVNARYLSRAQLPGPFPGADVVTVDCSFISLRLVLPTAIALLEPGGKLLALVKPQFEAGKAEADRGGGVISDPAIHRRVLSELETFVGTLADGRWRGVTPSPLLGPAGNQEFLVLLENAH